MKNMLFAAMLMFVFFLSPVLSAEDTDAGPDEPTCECGVGEDGECLPCE